MSSLADRQTPDALPETHASDVRPQTHLSEQQLHESLESIIRKEQLFDQTMRFLQKTAYSPELNKVFHRRWRIGQVAKLVGREPQTIRNYEKAGKLPSPPKDERGHRLGYTLEGINQIRDVFGTRPGREPEEEPAVVAFSTFKGGCGKTTLSVHFAQYMALKGYRVLMIDCDPQGSASTLFGENRDLRAALEEAADQQHDAPGLEYYLAGEIEDFQSCIVKTYFPGIDIVPAGLQLFDVEYSLASAMNEDPGFVNGLRDGVRSVWHHYDVVVIDPPPALGFLSLSVLNAANALVVPMRPAVIDFASTRIFLTMLRQTIEALMRAGFPVHHHFVTLAINQMDDSKSAHTEITEHMRTLFGAEDALAATMKDSAEIDNSGKELLTVYDLLKPMTGYKIHQRCITYLDSVNHEIETRIRRIWPSQRDALRQEAQL